LRAVWRAVAWAEKKDILRVVWLVAMKVECWAVTTVAD
jgi:hypothetical protein